MLSIFTRVSCKRSMIRHIKKRASSECVCMSCVPRFSFYSFPFLVLLRFSSLRAAVSVQDIEAVDLLGTSDQHPGGTPSAVGYQHTRKCRAAKHPAGAPQRPCEKHSDPASPPGGRNRQRMPLTGQDAGAWPWAAAVWRGEVPIHAHPWPVI